LLDLGLLYRFDKGEQGGQSGVSRARSVTTEN
jgi:hypothetical protein